MDTSSSALRLALEAGHEPGRAVVQLGGGLIGFPGARVGLGGLIIAADQVVAVGQDEGEVLHLMLSNRERHHVRVDAGELIANLVAARSGDCAPLVDFYRAPPEAGQ